MILVWSCLVPGAFSEQGLVLDHNLLDDYTIAAAQCALCSDLDMEHCLWDTQFSGRVFNVKVV